MFTALSGLTTALRPIVCCEAGLNLGQWAGVLSRAIPSDRVGRAGWRSAKSFFGLQLSVPAAIKLTPVPINMVYYV